MLNAILERETAKSPEVEQLKRLYGQAAGAAGLLRPEEQPGQRVMSRIGASMFFRDLRIMHHADLSPEQKEAAVAESIRVIREWGRPEVKEAAQEFYDRSKKEPQADLGWEKAGPETPQALQDARQAALLDYTTIVNEINEEKPDSPGYEELRQDADEAVATAAAILGIARTLRPESRKE